MGDDVIDPRWQKVVCTQCGRIYQCTPFDDWYGGLCTACLVGNMRVVTFDPTNWRVDE